MKILVFEDRAIHADFAKAQMGALGHEVLVCKQLDKINSDKKFLVEFDAVLTDMEMPMVFGDDIVMSSRCGFLVGLMSMEAGVPYIGILTDKDHHRDYFIKATMILGCRRFVIHGVQFYIGDQHMAIADPENLSEWTRPGYGIPDEKLNGKVEVKDWAKLLELLTAS